MKNLQRTIALILVLAMLAAFGCNKAKSPVGETTPITVDLADKTPQPDSPGAAPDTTAQPDANVSEEFKQLDLEIFRWYATDDGYSFHQLISDPAAYGIDRASVQMTIGEFTEESSKEFGNKADAYLERLLQIPRSMLTTDEQFSYDIIQQYLERASYTDEYAYFTEPLTEYSGLHAQMPLMFALFEIDCEQDAVDYLALLADVPRYLEQVLAYEQQRASLGMFMTNHALSAVLSGCRDIIESRDNSFLYATFSAAVDELTDITPERAAELKKQNESLVKNDFIDAYRMLHDGLKALKGKCRDDDVSLYNLGEQGLGFFEQCLQVESDSALSAEDALDMLQDEMYYMLIRSAEILEENPDALDEKVMFTTGDTESDLAMLKSMTDSILPALPAHNVTVSDVPEELENMMSPAAYVIPALDNWKDNRILINTASSGSDTLFTLAHEVYPGHMYQYVYQRGMEKLGTMQRALHFGGYAEGWSQMGEYLFVQNQTQFSKDYSEIYFYNNMIANALLPAIVSILVNYQGYTKAAIEKKLDALLLTNAEAMADSYYNLAVEQPFYTMCYAIGYSQLMQLMRDAENNLGDTFDRREFLTAYLGMGPGYFNIIQERMDVWVDERILETLGEG